MLAFIHRWKINRARRAAELELTLRNIEAERAQQKVLADYRRMREMADIAWPTGTLADFVDLTPDAWKQARPDRRP